MRKCIAAVLAILCLLTACSSQSEERDNVGQIIYAGVCMADGENAPYRQELEKELLRLGYYVNFADAKNDQSVQHDQISKFIREQYDILIIEPVMTVASDIIVTRLESANIPAVLLGKQPTEDVLALFRRVCYVGFDPAQPGLVQGQIILHTANCGDVNGDGQVACAVLSGPKEHTATGLHMDNCMLPLSEAGSDPVLLSQVYGDGTTERGKQLTEGLLAEFGRDIEVLFCGNDDMAMGALEALAASGRKVNEDIYVVGVGGAADVLLQVSQGEMTGTAMADNRVLAQQAAEAARLLLAHNAEKIYLVDYTLKETP